MAADAAIEAFVERMGLSAQADGLPRIAGRMLGLFIVHGGPFSFAELASQLRVSRGSVSTNARTLRGLGVIERIGRPGDRQDYYRLAEQPFARLLEGYLQRMRAMEDNVAELQTAIPAERRDIHRRLAEMRAFYDAAVACFAALTRRLRTGQAP